MKRIMDDYEKYVMIAKLRGILHFESITQKKKDNAILEVLEIIDDFLNYRVDSYQRSLVDNSEFAVGLKALLDKRDKEGFEDIDAVVRKFERDGKDSRSVLSLLDEIKDYCIREQIEVPSDSVPSITAIISFLHHKGVVNNGQK